MTNMSKNSDVQKVINTYCWISHSYTYQNKIISNFSNSGKEVNGNTIIYHSYYQWVPFMLFFQAILFYAPHWIWKMWEGGKIRMITKDIRGFNMDTIKKRRIKQDKLVCISNNSIRIVYTF